MDGCDELCQGYRSCSRNMVPRIQVAYERDKKIKNIQIYQIVIFFKFNSIQHHTKKQQKQSIIAMRTKLALMASDQAEQSGRLETPGGNRKTKTFPGEVPIGTSKQTVN
jgi:hypothetical protein